jgi:4-hydroxy-4-methyl-2-oxoglutarate aldolase
LHEAAGQSGALPSAIKPVAREMHVCGLAVTVECAPYDNLWLHRSLYVELPESAVLVASVGGAYDAGYWGEILAHAALKRGVAGLVIDGCVRDSALLTEIGFPVFSRGLCIRGTTKQPSSGGVNGTIEIGGVPIRAGDLVVGDADGVVVISTDQVEVVLDAASAREEKEAGILNRIHGGERTLDIYGFER